MERMTTAEREAWEYQRRKHAANFDAAQAKEAAEAKHLQPAPAKRAATGGPGAAGVPEYGWLFICGSILCGFGFVGVLLAVVSLAAATIRATYGGVADAVTLAGIGIVTLWSAVVTGAVGQAAIAFRDLVRHTLRQR